jgi:hypothetical protein
MYIMMKGKMGEKLGMKAVEVKKKKKKREKREKEMTAKQKQKIDHNTV